MAAESNAAGESGFDAVGVAVTLMRSVRAGALATLDRSAGFPLVTLTTLALDNDGVPLILVSQLSAHTRNLQANPRFSLLLSGGGKGDPLAHPRITLIGTASVCEDAAAKARFVEQNPKSKLYADFPDFSLWRLVPDEVHLNGGFARAFNGPAAPILEALRQAPTAKL